jgi:hypothetical protein
MRIPLRSKLSVAVFTASMVVLSIGVAPAVAGSVWWGLNSGSWPANLPREGTGKVVVTAQNRGYESANGSGVGSPIVLKDTLPTGLTIAMSKGVPEIEGIAGEGPGTGRGNAMTCSAPSPRQAECQFGEAALPPGEQLEMRITVKTAEASSGEENTVEVSGGNASANTLERPIDVGEKSGFGIEDFQLLPEEEGGRPSTQAGVHPFQLTSVLVLDTSEAAASLPNQEPAALTKDLTFQLPPGLIGNPTPFAQCTDQQFNSINAEGNGTQCSAQTTIGTATITYNAGSGRVPRTGTVPLSNLVPLMGEPARFGFVVAGTHTTLDTSLRTGGDYGVTVHISNVPEFIGFMASKVTFWGVPGSPRHDESRTNACIDGLPSCTLLAAQEPPPLLSLPTSCSGPMLTTVQADSWAEPHPAQPLEAPLFSSYTIGGLDGCNHLQFSPEINVAPDVPAASTPTGLGVQIHVPQTSVLNAESLAESTLRNTTVALPVGVAVNPGGADGLEACSEGEIGYQGKEQGEPNTSLFTPAPGSPFCPNTSKIGTVEIETPLLPHMLKGAVYLATQDENPFGTLLAMYIVAEDAVSGVLLKLPGEVSLDPSTGQLVSTFQNTPQLPFENLRLHFFGESRAPLGTPALCGGYVTNASFAPWSGNSPSNVSSTFNITSGPNGAPCQSSLPFSPSLTAETTNIQAGGFSPFTLTMSREDGQQNLQAISVHMPPGLSGFLAGVKLCGESEANAGTCGPESQIGETTVSVGLGGSPFTVTGGRVYITGPYHGAPFGLSIVNPAKAGPFDLEATTANHPACDCLVVRAKIEVDPHTAELTITSDNAGPYKIPTIIEGIPLQIKHVNVTIDRPGFTFNPTNCDPLAVTGSLSSAQGATAAISVPFQVTNCATLGFKPALKVSTSGKTSRASGASLNVKLIYPKAAFGSQANIRSVKVDLPKQLPSRLTTLQKACTARTFEENPASCPTASIVGHATAVTPLLPVPLTGPAYFVSHGGEAFPSLILVLQGDNVTLDLVGTTFISKAGVTSSTFKTVPDAPVGSFELNLPQGKFSALGANGSLCKAKLAMPTMFVAQNGAEIHASTKIAVTSCPKVKPEMIKKEPKKGRRGKGGKRAKR